MKTFELKKLVHYNPNTGKFTWLVNKGRAKKDSEVGSKHSSGYLETCVNRKRYLLHRLAWFYTHNEWPEQIDHINGIRTDNRLCNLRSVNDQINRQNMKKRCNNTSGFTGVTWDKRGEKWVAGIWVNKKYIYLGSSKDIDETIAMRKQANKKYNFGINHGT
ncbi:MAG: HNH endonuclease [Bacteroidetes bacterium]|nr:MAG: HNH endonuclease [Bacteroidota bacterium]